LAAFFHDIGHLLAFEEQETKSMGGFGVMHHEGLGEKLLVDCGVPAPIPKLVGNHIDAKRYNIYKDPSYYDRMSEGSKGTFAYQDIIFKISRIKYYMETFLKIRSREEL